MRAMLLLEYLLNKLDNNPNADVIYKTAIDKLDRNELIESESTIRQELEKQFLCELQKQNDITRIALYDSIGCELQRIKKIFSEKKNRDTIILIEIEALKKIRDDYLHDIETQKNKEKAATLIATQWKKRTQRINDEKSEREGFVLTGKPSEEEFQLV